MSVISAVAGFAAVAALITVIPGLDTALVLRTAITQGRRQGFATAWGINCGALIWGAGAAVGVSALLTASAVAYQCVRVVGAAYMICLGFLMLRSAIRSGGNPLAVSPIAARATSSAWRSWRRGLLTNLLNPKIGAFYVAVLPQFMPAHTSHLAMGLLLAGVHDVEGMVWFTALILGAGSLRGWLARRSAHRAIEATTGVALVGFGTQLAFGGR